MPASDLESPEASAPLTVISANLLNPWFRLGRVDEPNLRRRLELFALLVEGTGAGMVLCQEVGRGREFRVDSWLAQRLGMTALYERANGDAARFGREEGLAILSRYPLSSPVTCLLGGGLWHRPALGAVAETPLGPVAVYTAHLSLRPWRNRRQPALLAAWAEATAGDHPAIIGGDFNATDGSLPLRILRQTWIDAYASGSSPPLPSHTHMIAVGSHVIARRRIDYLYLRRGHGGIRVVTCEHRGGSSSFSDHLAVVGRFERIVP